MSDLEENPGNYPILCLLRLDTWCSYYYCFMDGRAFSNWLFLQPLQAQLLYSQLSLLVFFYNASSLRDRNLSRSIQLQPMMGSLPCSPLRKRTGQFSQNSPRACEIFHNLSKSTIRPPL